MAKVVAKIPVGSNVVGVVATATHSAPVKVVAVAEWNSDGAIPLYLVQLKDNTCVYLTEAQILKI
jgi:hypothetical protein